MIKRSTHADISAADFLPAWLTLPALIKAARNCQGCELYKRGTQTVFGEGPTDAKIMFIGEQPGDQEDRTGRPFVGPAGRVLADALDEVGIDRSLVYVTNAVKHFKWTPQGKRRLHSKPNARELTACRPWLEAELAVVQPAMIVCLGATAAQAMLGPSFRITKQRGRVLSTPEIPWIMATYHPSALLRVPDETTRAKMEEEFLHDIRLVAQELKKMGSSKKVKA